MPRNPYADTDMFERLLTNDVALSSGDLAVAEQLLDSIARLIEGETRRPFFEETATRYFDGDGKSFFAIPDLLTLTSLKFDDDGDGTFDETPVVDTDFRLIRPFHRDVYGATPKTAMQINPNGSFNNFPIGLRTMEMIATWGFTNDVESTGDTVQDATEQDATQTTLDVVATTNFSVGQTLKIENEKEYVQGVVSATQLTVERGVNGTTATTHANGTVIDRYIWIGESAPVREANLIQAGRLWSRRQSGFAGEMIVNPVTGNISLTQGLDADVKLMLAPLVRYD